MDLGVFCKKEGEWQRKVRSHLSPYGCSDYVGRCQLACGSFTSS
jgi:hypothetical protein